MNRRYFWTIPDCIKFRVVFEDRETVLGVNEANEHKLLRKDSGRIFFSPQDALKSFVADFLEKEVAAKTGEICV